MWAPLGFGMGCVPHWPLAINLNRIATEETVGLFLRYVVAETHATILAKQDAQLSQRDRAAWCIIVSAKSRRLELGDNILRTL